MIPGITFFIGACFFSKRKIQATPPKKAATLCFVCKIIKMDVAFVRVAVFVLRVAAVFCHVE